MEMNNREFIELALSDIIRSVFVNCNNIASVEDIAHYKNDGTPDEEKPFSRVTLTNGVIYECADFAMDILEAINGMIKEI